MGTRGFRIIKFRGRYWIFYNHWDSYPEGLGKSLVESIPTDPEDYQKWLQSQRDSFAKWDSLLQKLLIIQPEDLLKLHSDEPQIPVFHSAFDERLQEDAPPYHESGFNDLFIEWTYTIDLDREVFSVDNGAHFCLNHMPRNDEWMNALFRDNDGNRFLLPQLVPAESVATLSLDPPSFTASTKYETLQTRLVKAKGLDHLSPSYPTAPTLRWMLFNSIQKSQQRGLSVTLLGWQAQDLPFRELAFFILCLATGGENLVLVDQRRVKLPYDEGLYAGITTGNEPEGDAELASSLGVGYHMDGLPMGSAPKETKYWFEGALVCLVPQLDYPGIMEKAIADAVDYGRDICTRNSFNAVLLSIEHLVLIKSLPDGSVDHTELLPLIPITTHVSKDPRARYGDQAIDAFYNAKFNSDNQDVEEPDAMDVEQPIRDSDQQDDKSDYGGDDDEDTKSQAKDHDAKAKEEEAKDDDAQVEEGEAESDAEEAEEDEDDSGMDDEGGEDEVELIQRTPVTVATIKSSFMALIQFFEATALETLRPTQPNEARLPEEICEMVLRNVSDIETYNSCLRVSRRFRLICQRRPLVMDDVVFLEPLPNDPASSVRKDREEGTQGSPPASDFLAVEVSSGRQMEVWLRSGRGGDSLTCLIIAGNVWNRKTYIPNCGVRFQGLCLPTPWAEEAGERQEHAAWSRDEEPLLHGSQGTRWELSIRIYGINTESDTQTIGQFWVNAARALERPIEATREPAWTLPANTLCYSGTHDVYGDDGRKSFHYLYLRVKKRSKYWDNTWDDIIRETTENLNHTNDRGIKYNKCPVGEVVGADDPYVILVVGVEVRLFRWQQGFDASVDEEARRKRSPSSDLRELKSGKILNICKKTHREKIEKFLDKAAKHGEMIKARESERCGEKKRKRTV